MTGFASALLGASLGGGVPHAMSEFETKTDMRGKTLLAPKPSASRHSAEIDNDGVAGAVNTLLGLQHSEPVCRTMPLTRLFGESAKLVAVKAFL